MQYLDAACILDYLLLMLKCQLIMVMCKIGRKDNHWTSCHHRNFYRMMSLWDIPEQNFNIMDLHTNNHQLSELIGQNWALYIFAGYTSTLNNTLLTQQISQVRIGILDNSHLLVLNYYHVRYRSVFRRQVHKTLSGTDCLFYWQHLRNRITSIGQVWCRVVQSDLVYRSVWLRVSPFQVPHLYVVSCKKLETNTCITYYQFIHFRLTVLHMHKENLHTRFTCKYIY